MINRIILLMLFTFSSYAMSFNEASLIYAKLVHYNNFNVYPRLVLSNDSEVNAKYAMGTIVINSGMLQFVNNRNELAVVLGHELAHFALGHRGSTPANEYAADSLGAKYASRAGYNRCTGALVLYRFHDKGSATHPNSTIRYNRIKC